MTSTRKKTKVDGTTKITRSQRLNNKILFRQTRLQREHVRDGVRILTVKKKDVHMSFPLSQSPVISTQNRTKTVIGQHTKSLYRTQETRCQRRGYFIAVSRDETKECRVPRTLLCHPTSHIFSSPDSVSLRVGLSSFDNCLKQTGRDRTSTLPTREEPKDRGGLVISSMDLLGTH